MTQQNLTPLKDQWECCSFKCSTAKQSSNREHKMNRLGGAEEHPELRSGEGVEKTHLGILSTASLGQCMIFIASSFPTLIKDSKLVHVSLGTLMSCRQDGIWNRQPVFWDSSVCFHHSLWNLIMCYLDSNFSIWSMILMLIIITAAKT